MTDFPKVIRKRIDAWKAANWPTKGGIWGLSTSGENWGVAYRLAFLEENHVRFDGLVVDVGCGDGRYLARIKDCVGIEPCLDFFKKKEPCVRVRAVGEAIPLRSRSSSLVLIIEVIEHVKDVSRVLAETKRVLRQDGYLFVTAPNRFFPFETHGFHLERNYDNFLGIPLLSFAPKCLRKHLEQARIYSQKDLVQLLKKHGFEVCQISYMPIPFDKAPHNAFFNSIRTVSRRLSHFVPIKQMGTSCMVLARASSTS